MKEQAGDLWDLYGENLFNAWRVITTNGDVNAGGRAVMGRGVAKEASLRYPALAQELALRLERTGNHVYAFPAWGIITFPVKVHWNEPARTGLIHQSVQELVTIVTALGLRWVFMVRPGCGNGGLQWEEMVKPLIEKHLDDRFIVIEKEAQP